MNDFDDFMDFLYGISFAIVSFVVLAIIIAVAYWWW